MSTQSSERRPLGALGRMGVVAALHVGVLYLIASSMGIVPSIIDKGIETTVIDEPRTPEDPIPRTDPVDLPHPSIVLPEEPPPLQYDQPDVITAPPADLTQPPEHPGSTVVQPVMVGVQLDSRHPLSQPPYPPMDVRQGNTGTADIEIYVMPNGRVSDARIVKSTGFPSLDQSALDEAKRKWRLVPATRDGEPFAQWHRLRVTFKLNEQQR